MANEVTLVGNVGQDPEIRKTTSGDNIANISLATSERWKNKQGEQQEKTEWHKVVVFGKLADVVQKYVNKGDKLYFRGKLQTRKWQDKEGQDRYSTEVVIDFGGKMEMLGSKGGDNKGYQENVTKAEVTKQDVDMSVNTAQAECDSDIPF